MIGILLAIPGAILGIKELTSEEEPTTADECMEQSDVSGEYESVVESVYCEVEFTNIWVPGRTLEMLDENRQLIVDSLDRIAIPSAEHPYTRFEYYNKYVLTPSLEAQIQYEDLNQIFIDWPNHRHQASFVSGYVDTPTKLEEEGGISEWVFHLATEHNPKNQLYVKVLEPSHWESPYENCHRAVAEVIPIARGSVISNFPEVDSLEVVYTIAPSFACFPAELEDDAEGISEDSLESIEEQLQ